MRIRARQGVVLASGGFAHNAEMRQQYGGDEPNGARWSISNPGDTGEALKTAMRHRGQTDLMDEAWWLPSPRTGRFGQSTLDQARQRPRTIYVDAAGKRFVNESNSYMEVGKAMYARDKTSRAVPCWLIFDDRYRKRYAHQRSSPVDSPRSCFESGHSSRPGHSTTWPRCAASIRPACPRRSNASTSTPPTGVDPDYGRGESAYNRALGDPNPRVHPCLGPIDEAPYYAVQVVPGDIGTCGGLVTNEHARVIGEDDRPSRVSTPRATAPPPSWAVTTSGPGPASPTPWSSGMSPPVTPPARRFPIRRWPSGQRDTVSSNRDSRGRALSRRRDDRLLGRGAGIDDNGDAVTVQVEHAGCFIHTVPRTHAHVAVDVDFETHAEIVFVPRVARG